MPFKVHSPATPETCYVLEVCVPFSSPLILSGERTKHLDKSRVKIVGHLVVEVVDPKAFVELPSLAYLLTGLQSSHFLVACVAH